MRLQTHGVNQVDPGEAVLRAVDRDGVFPEDFYSTTNLETVVRLGADWVPVEQPEMDCGLVVEDGRVRTSRSATSRPACRSSAAPAASRWCSRCASTAPRATGSSSCRRR